MAAGLIGDRTEPLVGSLLFLFAAAILLALHPARQEFLGRSGRVSLPLGALSIVAAVPGVWYAASMLALAADAGPSCFFGECAHGDRFAEMAAAAISIVLVGLLAAMRTPGWRLAVWSAGAAAVVIGSGIHCAPQRTRYNRGGLGSPCRHMGYRIRHRGRAVHTTQARLRGKARIVTPRVRPRRPFHGVRDPAM